MSFVEEALRIQRKVWTKIVENQIINGLANDLPPRFPKRVVFFGEGSSFYAAKLCEFILNKLKTRTEFVAISSTDFRKGYSIQSTDWAFGFTHRGQTASTLEVLRQYQASGVFTVLVAGQGVTSHQFAKMILHTSPMEKCEPHTIGMTGAVCAVTTLLGELGEEWKALGSKPDPDLEGLRKKLVKPDVLVGQWEGEWVAREISLKLLEMAQVSARVFGSEEFFHGPRVNLMNPQIWHLHVPGDMRTKDIHPAYEVQIGQGSLSSVSALVELQWSVLALALNLGLNPDGKV